MLYSAYQAFSDSMSPLRLAAKVALGMQPFMPLPGGPLLRRGMALASVVDSARMTHKRPPYQITTATCGNRVVPVREEVAASTPFGDLLHFAKDDVGAPQPRILVVAPLSGHFATLLRSTVQTLLQDHDVYITDWKNARDVPVSAGRFGFEDYTDHVITWLQDMGPGSHVLAVCQPCVPTLAAVALMAEDNDPAQPRSMTLMGGPVDTRIAPTVVNQLATTNSFDWFERSLITTVPFRYAGRGRRVYPGFLQLVAFMSMNLERHGSQYRKLYQLIADGEEEEAGFIRDFYDEYMAVLDLTRNSISKRSIACSSARCWPRANSNIAGARCGPARSAALRC
jgi:poly(3-hydroxybutyrate) depolymerase